MDAASLVLIVIGLLTLLGAASASAGADTRDGFGRDGFRHDHMPRDVAPRLR